jgi:hypothetical protein
MLANVLKSAVAVRASIQVVRAFVRLRQFLATNEKLARQIEAETEQEAIGDPVIWLEQGRVRLSPGFDLAALQESLP